MKQHHSNQKENQACWQALDRGGPMASMSIVEMEQISGGDRAQQCTAWRVICTIAGVGSIFGGVLGGLILGPTALMCTLDTAIDFSHC